MLLVQHIQYATITAEFVSILALIVKLQRLAELFLIRFEPPIRLRIVQRKFVTGRRMISNDATREGPRTSSYRSDVANSPPGIRA